MNNHIVKQFKANSTLSAVAFTITFLSGCTPWKNDEDLCDFIENESSDDCSGDEDCITVVCSYFCDVETLGELPKVTASYRAVELAKDRCEEFYHNGTFWSMNECIAGEKEQELLFVSCDNVSD